jgi:hypothetical protein
VIALDNGADIFRHRVELDTDVEVLGVFSDHHDVYILVSRLDSRVAFAGSQAGIKVELLSQGDVHTPEARADGRGHRTFESDLVLPDGVEHFFWQRCAVFLERSLADLVHIPLYRDAGSFQRPHGSFGYLRPNAVSWDEGDVIRHNRFSP